MLLVPLSVHRKFDKVISFTVSPVVFSLSYLWTGHLSYLYLEWWLTLVPSSESFIHICGFRIEARREIYGGIGLGVALAAIISMFAMSNVSKVSSIEISGKLIGKRLVFTLLGLPWQSCCGHLCGTYGYNLWYTSRTHGRWASKRVNNLSTLNPYVLVWAECGSIGNTRFYGNVKTVESYGELNTAFIISPLVDLGFQVGIALNLLWTLY